MKSSFLNIKTLCLIFAALLAQTSSATTLLGVEEGTYDGAGPMQMLPSIEVVIPAISFTSHRELKGDTITAVSTAYFSPSILDNIPKIGPWLTEKTKVTIVAHLRVVSANDGTGQFQILDLDNNSAVAGRAICLVNSCTFRATLKNNSFELAETWSRTEHGFDLSYGSQSFDGLPANYSGQFYATTSSFNEIQRMVFAKPLNYLPLRNGIGPMQVLEALLTGVGEISDRSEATFASHADFRPARDKLLHPLGICAVAQWNVTERSLATGLFSQGSHVNGIIRFSTGTAEPAYVKDGRIAGFALKLFPTQDLDENVETVNFQTLDTYGFDRSPRKRFFYEDQDPNGVSRPVQFTNVAPAKSAFGQTLAKFFDRFDQPNFARPVYMGSKISSRNQNVLETVSPYEVRFVPHFTPHTEPTSRLETQDFRSELLSYRPGELVFDVMIASLEPTGNSKILRTFPQPRKIGTLTIGEMVISDACDRNLHFNHPRNRVIPEVAP